jgi:hypothetical protein
MPFENQWVSGVWADWGAEEITAGRQKVTIFVTSVAGRPR